MEANGRATINIAMQVYLTHSSRGEIMARDGPFEERAAGGAYGEIRPQGPVPKEVLKK